MIDVDSVVPDSRGNGPQSNSHESKLFSRGRVIVKDIGEQTKKKNRWNVTLLRHKRFDTVKKLNLSL